MIKEIQAKTLLSHVRQPDSWFGLRYNLNLYRGCQHGCIYCDSRSLCYQIENFSDILVKVNAIDLLADELPRKRVKGTIGTGSMNDPYMPVERRYNLTGQALELIARHGFGVHVITKSDLVLKDLDTLRQISHVHAVVSFTITTADDDLAHKIEPGAPPPSARFAAMSVLAQNGIHTGVTLMPVLPFIEDNPENIAEIIEQTAAHGGQYILPAFSMTLRDRQRAYYYDKLDVHFPGLRQRYIARFGDQYGCKVDNADALYQLFHERCQQHNIATRIPSYQPDIPEQLSLL